MKNKKKWISIYSVLLLKCLFAQKPILRSISDDKNFYEWKKAKYPKTKFIQKKKIIRT